VILTEIRAFIITKAISKNKAELVKDKSKLPNG
jgi:hypothetical protein